MISDSYYTLAQASEASYKDKGSKFLAFAYPADNEEVIKGHLQELRKRYFDATHHCYAYIWGEKSENYRVNDDGEPNNSAGMPILGQIRARNLSNVLVVVVRYFGGTKLGVSGLIQAYRTASAEVLDNATIIEKHCLEQFSVQFEYSQMNLIMRILKELEATIHQQTMDLNCVIQFSVRKQSSIIVRNKLASFLI